MRRSLATFTTVAIVASGLFVAAASGQASAVADATVASMSAVGASSCALTSAGAAKCWGLNQYGELGDGTTIARNTPVDVVGLGSGVAAISTSFNNTCAIVTGGGVKCWGYNGQRELGDGSTTTSNVPVDVVGLGAPAVSISTGTEQECVVTDTGGAKCWGDNAVGELGNGSTTPAGGPVAVSGLGSGVAQVAAGDRYSCALTTLGAVKCWGLNTYGELGNSTTTDSSSPVDVTGLGSGVTAISAGDDQACALMASGTVKCWGRNQWGQLGDGTHVDASTPVDVTALGSGVVAVSSGSEATCAITGAGALECWGHNNWGQLGDGPSGNSDAPVGVVGLGSGVAAVSVGSSHTCALTVSAAMLCWGFDYDGQLGNGASSAMTLPTRVFGLDSGMAQVAAGAHHSCAISAGDALSCWGDNALGSLGDGTTLERDVPVSVVGLGPVSAVATGYGFTCAVTAAGAVKCWGDNGSGQLGDGTTTSSDAPVSVTGLDSGAVAVAAGVNYACALTGDGAVECWGDNQWGQLGDGTFTSRTTPVTVSGIGSTVLAIDAAGTVTCAVTAAHGLKCWGGENNLLGDGTTQFSAVPVQVSGLTSGVAAVTVGYNVSCAVTTGHALDCWGFGPVGDGSQAQLSPVAIPSLGSTVAAVSSGPDSTCVRTLAGAAKCWGGNGSGEVGDGTTTARDTPVAVSGLGSGVTSISVKGDHACAVVAAGAVDCWGGNTTGQIGVGTSGYSSVPVGVVGLGLNGATIPSAPGTVVVAAGENSANLAWTTPSDTGGASIAGYLVTITNASGGFPTGLGGSRVRVVTSGMTLSTGTTLRVGGLANGTGYRLDVAPVNRAGIGRARLSPVVKPGSHPPTSGYWMLGATGSVYAFGNAPYLGSATLPWVTHIEPTPTRRGYWIVDAAGEVSAFGDAWHLPGLGPRFPDEIVTGLSATPSGRGFWLFTSLGRVVSRGDASRFGDLIGVPLNGPIVGAVATPTGRGYYMVGSDGGVFAFGDAHFRGSMGGARLNRPVEALVPTKDNRGYWLVASDGGIFSFGAPFRGSLGGTHLNRPVTAMVRYGNGYLMVASDGGVFDFSNLAFRGSLGGQALPAPIVSIASTS